MIFVGPETEAMEHIIATLDGNLTAITTSDNPKRFLAVDIARTKNSIRLNQTL